MTIRSSAPPIVHYEEPQQHVAAATTGIRLLSSTSPSFTAPPSSSSSSPIAIVGVPAAAAAATVTAPTVAGTKFNSLGHSLRSRMRLQLPTLTELHVLYLGIMLAIMLALFSVFLLYRILDIEAKTNLYNTPVDFNVVGTIYEYIYINIEYGFIYLYLSFSLSLFSARATMRTSLRKRCAGKRSCRTRARRKLSIFYPRILNRYPR